MTRFSIFFLYFIIIVIYNYYIMLDIDWFKFENKNLDFPFYKKNPYLPKWGWIVLFFCICLGFLFQLVEASDFPSMVKALVLGFFGCCIMIVPILYFLKWDYKAIFQKPSLRDIALALGLFVGYLIYALCIGSVLDMIHISSPVLVNESTTTIFSIPPLIFSLMGEEIIKFVPFIFFLRILYKYTDNRKLSVIASMLLVMAFFAFLHSFEPKYFLFAFCVQGLGSIFEFIGYIKTKNILISYITHLCTDVFIFTLIILGAA